MTFHRLQHRIGGLGRHDCDQFAFVGDIKRIQAEQLARTSYLFVDGKGTFLQFDPNPRTLCDFVQRAGDAASRRVAHAANVTSYTKYLRHQRVQGSTVALDLSLEFQPLALRQNRDAVIADRTAKEHLVPRTGAVGGKVDSFWHQSNSCRVDEQPVALTFLDHLGIAGHHLHARFRRHLAQRTHHAPEFVYREALFNDEGGAQKQRRCAAHRQIIYRAVNRERTDVAAGKEQWLYYEGIGGDGETLAVHIHDGLVIQARQHRILKRRQEDVANQLGAQLAAAAVPQQDCVFGRERRRATELEFYFGVGFRGHAPSYFATAWRR